MQTLLIVALLIIILIFIINFKSSKPATRKSVQKKKSDGTIRVYRSRYDYTDYSSLYLYQDSQDYSPSESIIEVSSFEGFDGGSFSGGGAGGSYTHTHTHTPAHNDDSDDGDSGISCDSSYHSGGHDDGGGCDGGGGDGGGGGD